MTKFLIVGLGNPGTQYIKTRHNIGYDFLTFLSDEMNFSFDKKNFKGNFAKVIVDDKEIYFAQPQTYMNLSGEFVKQFTDFYKIDIDNILVIYDDISIPLLNYKLKKQGSSGGQNGIANIILKYNTEKIKRLKIGIGSENKNNYQNLADFVLSKFSNKEFEMMKDKFYIFKNIILDFISLDFEKLMSKYNESI